MDIKKYRKTLLSSLALSIVLVASKLFTAFYIISLAHGIFLIFLGSILFSIIFPFITALIIINDLRKNCGGYWTFKEATKNIFIMLMIASSISYAAVNIIYDKLIDPDMEKNVALSMYNATVDYVQNNTLSNEQEHKINAAKDQLKSLDNQRFEDRLLWMAKYLIIICIASLILGAIYQKKLFVSPNEEFSEF